VDFKGNGPTNEQITHPRVIETKILDLVPGDQNIDYLVPSNLSALPQVDACEVQEGDFQNGPGIAGLFWGTGRDGNILVTTATAFVDVGDTYTIVPNMTHTPVAGGVPSSKEFGFQAKVVNIDTSTGKVITIDTSPTMAQLEPYDAIIWQVVEGWSSVSPDINACGGNLFRGKWGVTGVLSVVGSVITLDKSVSNSPGTINNANISSGGSSVGTAHCTIRIQRVSLFEQIQIDAGATLQFTNNGYNFATGTGGIAVVFVKELIVNGTLAINMTGNGFPSFSAGRGMGLAGILGGDGGAKRKWWWNRYRYLL